MAFAPNVVGVACCSQVRPAIGVAAYRSASRAAASPVQRQLAEGEHEDRNADSLVQLVEQELQQ